jgi:hypothetical protein
MTGSLIARRARLQSAVIAADLASAEALEREVHTCHCSWLRALAQGTDGLPAALAQPVLLCTPALRAHLS